VSARGSDTPGTGGAVPVLEARHLTKHFAVGASRRTGVARHVIRAVDDVSLRLRAGAAVALVGESGSGKSTVARLLARLLPAASGEVLLNGEVVRARSDRARRGYTREVQLLLQDPFSSLNPLHTIRYTLTRALRLHRGRAGRTERDEQLAELLTRVRLTPPEWFLDKFPHELSGGQLQRVATARTLAASPSVLLLDEPVSMVDVSIRAGLLNLFTELKEHDGIALLYITHDIASARYFADDVIVMYHGQMVEGGGSEQVTEHPGHPYTELLMAASPDPDRRHRTVTRPARPPGPRPPVAAEGCRFATQCPHAMPVCATTAPPTVDLGEGHWARCWLHTVTTP
jgi:peptide/nickel transport system ATP-binding protein